MNEEDKNVAMVVGYLIAVCVYPFMLMVNIIFGGFVVMQLWKWFVVPTFEWAVPLTMPYAIGISLVVGYLTYHKSSTTKSQRKEISDNILSEIWSDFMVAVIHATAILLIGWIVAQFI